MDGCTRVFDGGLILCADRIAIAFVHYFSPIVANYDELGFQIV